MRPVLYLIGLLSLLFQECEAQPGDSLRTTHLQVDVGGWVATGGVMPFWMQVNQYGTVPTTTPAATVRARLWKAYAPADSANRRRNRFGWGYGISPVLNAGSNVPLLLPEAYVNVKFGALELLVGRRRQPTGLGDSTLSSGNIAISDNAQPIPKIQLATRGYAPLGFLGKFVAINAGYVHGWFNVPYLQHSLLHQKYIYLRFGKPASPVKLHLGLNHQVQWGGQADYLLAEPGLAVNGKLPASLKYYPYVIFAVNPGVWANDDFTSFDGAYRIGNHVGSIDGAVEVRSGRGNWKLYHQHIYEDVSGLLFLNVPDGLTGLSWARRGPTPAAGFRLDRLVAEFITTLDQTGPTFDLPNSPYQGADNYYNHGQYREGWSYLGRGLGTPFISPFTELNPQARTNVFFPNNRVQAVYVGATGRLLNRIGLTTRLSYSRNYGTFSAPYATPLPQFSGLLTAQATLPRRAGTSLILSLAVDQGQLRPSTVGTYIGLRRQW